MKQARGTYVGDYNKRFKIFYLVVLLDLMILLLVLFLYSSLIVRPIRHLSEVADKISMGDLKTTIRVKGKGEVALLAQSIERMQASVKAAIERLQKRKSGTVLV